MRNGRIRAAGPRLGLAFVAALALAAGDSVTAAEPAAEARAGTPRAAELPELAGLGARPVGVERQSLAAAGREIAVRLWYPAAEAPRSAAVYRHTLSPPGARPVALEQRGVAGKGAAPAAGGSFPLVVISHGYGGWDTHMSELAEALASHGYVVAAIDHADQPFTDIPTFAASFGSVLRHRAADQRTVLRALLGGRLASPAVAALIDRKSVALIGYSMGGYGALTTAGARLDPAAPAFATLPEAERKALAAPDAAMAGQIDAVVALAPWGAQPGSTAWSDAGLAGITAPLLLIAGNRDDVVDFDKGVQRIFAAATGSDRRLLVYREAGHNIAGNPVELPPGSDFQAIEYVTDPVWRADRIAAINQHFIRAFLDATLKRDAAAGRYLAVPTPLSNDGDWPSRFGEQWGGTYAGDAQPGYWRGFQRRWARGLELHHREAE